MSDGKQRPPLPTWTEAGTILAARRRGGADGRGDHDEVPRIDLHRERRREQIGIFTQSRRHAFWLAALSAATLLVLTPLTLHLRAGRIDLARIARDARFLTEQQTALTRQESLLDARAAGWDTWTQGRSRRRAWGDLLNALAARTPTTVLLDTVQVENDEKNNGARVTVQGSATEIDALRIFVAGLEQTVLLADVRLRDTSSDTVLGPRGVHFRIEAACPAVAGP